MPPHVAGPRGGLEGEMKDPPTLVERLLQRVIWENPGLWRGSPQFSGEDLPILVKHLHGVTFMDGGIPPL